MDNTGKVLPSESALTMLGMARGEMQAWQELVDECARFFTEQFNQNADVRDAFLACGTPQEVMEVQTRFFFRAFANYSEAATRVVDVMLTSRSAVVGDAAAVHSRRYGDFPL